MARQAHAFVITDGNNAKVFEMLKREIAFLMQITTAADFANALFENLTLNGDGSVTINFSFLPREENTA